MGEDRTRGQSRPENADTSGESGWITTEVAAKAVRVSPRTIRRYIERGELEAKPHGEGVRREWLVSVDSLHALRATRTSGAGVPEADREMEYADSIADVVREMAARLESRAEEAAELRVRLELTERAQSTLEDERSQALQELEEERRRREEAEREREDLRRELQALREATEGAESVEERHRRREPEGTEPRSGTPGPQTSPQRRSLWRRMFGGG
jgi:DNA-binding transcriptional MerR regulator